MSDFLAAVLIVIWLWCGYLAAGYVFAYFQREFPTIASQKRSADLATSLLGFVFGPISLAAAHPEFVKHGRLYPWQVSLSKGRLTPAKLAARLRRGEKWIIDNREGDQ